MSKINIFMQYKNTLIAYGLNFNTEAIVKAIKNLKKKILLSAVVKKLLL